jgi:hypothetical protein
MENLIIAVVVLGLGYFIYTRIKGKKKRGGGGFGSDRRDAD